MLLLIGIIGYSFLTYQWLMGIIAAAFVFMALRYTTPREEAMVPKPSFPTIPKVSPLY